MQGKRVEATNATIALGSAPVDSAAQWVQQVRHLYLADCAWLTHKKRLALRQASKGVTGPFASPLASGFTGIHARWLARIQPDQEFTRSYLEQLLNDAPSFDLFDRAEIALAVRLANEGLSPSLRRSLDIQAQAFLDELPPQVGAFFAMLEILPKPGSARRARTNKTE
jgi:hypothetical protein